MNNTESIRINHPSSVPRHHQEPDSPSGQLFFYYILNAVSSYSSHVHYSAHLLKNIPSCVLWEHLWFFTLRKIYIIWMHCGQINSFVCMCTSSREIPKKRKTTETRNADVVSAGKYFQASRVGGTWVILRLQSLLHSPTRL